MDNREPTRVRAHGRKVHNNLDGPGIIAACRKIKKTATFAKINGVAVDLFSASAIVAVYDAAVSRGISVEKFLALPVHKMARVAFKCVS